MVTAIYTIYRFTRPEIALWLGTNPAIAAMDVAFADEDFWKKVLRSSIKASSLMA